MKDKWNSQYRELNYHVELPFFENLKHIATEHDYHGFLETFVFYITVLKDYLFHLIARVLPFSGINVALHRSRGVKIGKNVHIGPGVIIDDVYPCYVEIGNGVSLAGQNTILVHNKPMVYHKKISKSYVEKVSIKDNAWIAIGVIILPGVEIGEGSIIASGSVVTKSIPPFVLAAGSPAVVKKDISEQVKHNYTENKFNEIMMGRKDKFGI